RLPVNSAELQSAVPRGDNRFSLGERLSVTCFGLRQLRYSRGRACQWILACTSGVGDEIRAVDKLHSEEPLPPIGNQIVKRHQVRMTNVRQGAKLAFKTIKGIRAAAVQSLQRNDG